ncbi:hypothetical protein D3C85_851010 [compost metagenome]
MKPLFYSISIRTAGHGVRCTLLALRQSALLPLPAANTNQYQPRKSAVDAVRWLDLHCHLNALYRRPHHQGSPSGPRSLQ